MDQEEEVPYAAERELFFFFCKIKFLGRRETEVDIRFCLVSVWRDHELCDRLDCVCIRKMAGIRTRGAPWTTLV